MIYFKCAICEKVFKVVGPIQFVWELVDTYLGQKIKPQCCDTSCKGVADRVEPTENAIEVPVISFFRSMHGLGIGKISTAEPDRVRELLLGTPIVSVNMTPIGEPLRCIIRDILLANGVRLHFANSNHGACIFSIEEPE